MRTRSMVLTLIAVFMLILIALAARWRGGELMSRVIPAIHGH